MTSPESDNSNESGVIIRQSSLINPTTRRIFAVYVILLAARDVVSEVWLSGVPWATMNWWIFVTCSSLGIIFLILTGHPAEFFGRLKDWTNASAVIILGIVTAVIYAVTFAMINPTRLGAAFFNLLDFGLAPFTIATAGFAIDWARKLNNRSDQKALNFPIGELLVSFGLYSVGIILLYWWPVFGLKLAPKSPIFVSIALLSPLLMAVSDALSKWLLEFRGFTRPEVMVLRFWFGAIAFGLYIYKTGLPFVPAQWPSVMAVAVLLAFLPLWLLYGVLPREALQRLAVWETLIPALIFLSTLYWHPEHRDFVPILGVLFIFGAYVVFEMQLVTRFKNRQKR